MNLFTVKEQIVIPTTEVLLISPFKEIWERDNDEHKAEAIREFSYIEFMCSPKKSNPFSGYTDDTRHTKIVERLFRNDVRAADSEPWMPDTLVNDAMDLYKEFMFNASPSLRMLGGARTAMTKLEAFFENFDFQQTNNSGTPLYKPKDITTALKEMGEVARTLNSLQEKVEQEIYDNVKTKGNREINYFEE